MGQLTTNWIRIASAGNAIDGRLIPEKVIKELAETYNPEEFAARIWPEHRRYFGAWGDVLALKAEEWKGKVRLFAKLKPNSQLMLANESDQKTYCSIELNIQDFDGTGKHYLAGLGVTDQPGSLGAEKLQFNANDNGSYYSEPEVFVIDEVIETHSGSKAGLFRRVLNTFTQNVPSKDEDEELMNTEQFNQMMGKLDDIETKQNELEEKQTEFASQVEQFSIQGKSEADPKKDDEPASKGESITAEQFSQVTDKLDTLITKQSDMEHQFTALKQEVPNQVPAGEGAGNNTKMETF